MSRDEELFVVRRELQRILAASGARDFVWSIAEVNRYAELCQREKELLAA